MKERDISKLPVWAQHEIERLRKDNAYYQAKLSAGPENSRVFADPYSEEARRPLGDSDIAFTVGDDPEAWMSKILVKLTQGHDKEYELEIYGGDSLIVMPQSSNVIRVRLGRLL